MQDSKDREIPVDRAVSILERGGIVAFPTETFYGLGVDPFNEEALRKVFFIKQRPANMPILVLVDGEKMLDRLVEYIPDIYRPLMARHWPGPLTLLFPAKSHLSATLTGGTGKIGIRISPNPHVIRLLKAWKRPITATSANISGKVPATEASAVIESFGDAIECVIDGGRTPGGSSSTILSCREGRLTVVRQGKLDIDVAALPGIS